MNLNFALFKDTCSLAQLRLLVKVFEEEQRRWPRDTEIRAQLQGEITILQDQIIDRQLGHGRWWRHVAGWLLLLTAWLAAWVVRLALRG